MKICEKKVRKEFSWVKEGGGIIREQNHRCQDFKINKHTERTCTIEVSPRGLFLGRILVASGAKPGPSCFGKVREGSGGQEGARLLSRQRFRRKERRLLHVGVLARLITAA